MQVLSIGRKKRIQALAFAPGGRELAAPCGDRVLRVWDLTTGEVRRSVPLEETSSGYDLVYLADGRLVLTGVGLRCWDLAADTWTEVRPGLRWGRQLALSPDGRTLAEVDQTSSTDWGG